MNLASHVLFTFSRKSCSSRLYGTYVRHTAGTQCPVTAFSITGFAGRGDGSGSARTSTLPFNFSTANLNNYGVAAGITLPIGGGTSLCKELTKQQVEFEAGRVQTLLLKNQITLIKQCHELDQSGLFEDNNFQDNNDLSAIKACESISFKGVTSILNDPSKIEISKPASETQTLQLLNTPN